MHLRSRIFASGLLLPAFAALLTGCDTSKLQDLENDLEVILNVPGLPATHVVQIIDATSEVPVAAEVSIRVTGEDADQVIDPIFFETVESTTSNTGSVFLGIQDGVTPTPEDPVDIKLHLTAPGYVETSSAVSVETEGISESQVTLVPIASPPEGVAGTSESTGSASTEGKTTEDILVVTPPESQSGGQAAIEIPAGTLLTTAEGEPLTGSLQATVTYFNNQAPASLEAFPGGLDNVTVEGQTERGAFISAGFVSVSLTDSQGREAANLSSAADVTLSIPEGTINPETGQPVQPGDVIPLWSLDPETGTWKSEGEVVAESPAKADLSAQLASFEGSRNLLARFATDHFSYFNLDYYRNRCLVGHSFQFDRFPEKTVLMELQLPGYWRRIYVAPWLEAHFQPLTLVRAPLASINAMWRVRDASSWEVLAEGTVSSLCDPGTTTISLTDPDEGADLVDLDLALDIVCEKGSSRQVFKTNYPFLYHRPVQGTRWTSGQLVNGRALLTSLHYGETYEVAVSIREGDVWTQEIRSFKLTENPEIADIGEHLEFVSGERNGDRLSLAYRATNFAPVCDAI